MKVLICSHVDPYYSGFYIYGLEKLLGKKNVSYTIKGFEDILPYVWNVYLAFIIIDNDGCTTKYVIDSNDYCTIKKEMYDWCDVYGHCNANFLMYSKEDHPKLVVLCPSFGVRCWNLAETIYRCITNICKLRFHVPSIKKYIWRYYKQYRRRTYSDYTIKSAHTYIHTYIYCCNTLWYNTGNVNNDTGVNYVRTLFIDACKEIPDVCFEGGLVPTKRSQKQSDKFTKYLTPSVSAKEYLEKIQQSKLVFNTPAFWDCHGWKLGEYMALGKCIISTPISNELPTPIEYSDKTDKAWMSEYFYIVDKNKQSMKDAIEYLKNNSQHREMMESRVAKYWENNGTPIASLKRLGIKC